MKVPYLSLQDVTRQYSDELHRAIGQVIDSGWYLQGEENEKFEAEYSSYIGTRHAIGVANGLDALSILFQAYIELGLMKPGDEVIVPANTYIASIIAITKNGLVPVLVEPLLETYQLDDSLIEARIGPRTKAILLVHLYGQCAYTEKIGALCARYGLRLVEDNAQAHGCRFGERRTGSIGDSAGHSFYPGKNIGAFGDAGAITTNDDELAGVSRAIANYGSTRKYVFKYVGQNSRLDEIQAAVLRIKLKHLEKELVKRRNVARNYLERIKNERIVLPVIKDWNSHVFHIFPIRSADRNNLQEYLKNLGIQTIIHYPIPPHRQECYKEWNGMSLPITELIHDEELSLPIGPVMSDAQLDHVIKALNAW